jgi:uncharacterized YccA/Bax inhibitor family protein
MAQNPVFNAKTLLKLRAGVSDDVQTMTVNGTINKTGILLVLMSITSVISWNLADSEIGGMLMMGSMIANLALCLVLAFNQRLAPTLAPAYALVEGLFLGALSAMFERSHPGIVSNAMILTFSCLGLMLGLYRFRVVRVTDRFRSVVMAATLAVCFTYVIDLALSFFGHSIPMIHQTGVYGIIFSLVVIGIAAMNLLLDFDMVERATAQHAPKYMEWYAGFAILVTIVWLYIEMLRLLTKISKR